ncbi:uncharacterized protein PG998_003463 [Apiospora kogelbergensis]|uniref:Uncharacterized protein n=1 Tax=Apiospora kogelbergensis TaxID=1337665 RepID=A0AAW0QL92_9PEZI
MPGVLVCFGPILTGDRRVAVVLAESRSPTVLPEADNACASKRLAKLLATLHAGRSDGLLHVLAGYAQADLQILTAGFSSWGDKTRNGEKRGASVRPSPCPLPPAR